MVVGLVCVLFDLACPKLSERPRYNCLIGLGQRLNLLDELLAETRQKLPARATLLSPPSGIFQLVDCRFVRISVIFPRPLNNSHGRMDG